MTEMHNCCPCIVSYLHARWSACLHMCLHMNATSHCTSCKPTNLQSNVCCRASGTCIVLHIVVHPGAPLTQVFLPTSCCHVVCPCHFASTNILNVMTCHVSKQCLLICCTCLADLTTKEEKCDGYAFGAYIQCGGSINCPAASCTCSDASW